ncbi:MAG: acylphosphatase [Candidatus Omnitrophica bacterium]|nr:acylphosphatase [Candidatus Omnitrophota bacterium]
MVKRLRVHWSGRVQGVGFRYTAEAVALELKLTGWVMNLHDGRVEAVCEGPEKALQEFLERIASGPMKSHIAQTQTQWLEPTGEFKDFGIRFF